MNQNVATKWSEVLTDETINAIEERLVFTAYQDGCSMLMEFTGFPDCERTKSKLCGTILNELFAWVELQKKIGAKGFKLNMPIHLRFEVNGIMFDSGSVRKESQQTLKLQNNEKGRKRYAGKFWSVFQFATRKIVIKDMEELNAGLDAILSAA